MSSQSDSSFQGRESAVLRDEAPRRVSVEGRASNASNRSVSASRPAHSQSNSNRASVGNTRASGPHSARKGSSTWKKGSRADAEKKPDPILFQTYFKSVGPRTYAAQMKQAGNGNHYLVFTEGKRDKVTDEVRKTSLYVFSEDFVSFFKMLKEAAEHVRAHPVPADIALKRSQFWQSQKPSSSDSKPALNRAKR